MKNLYIYHVFTGIGGRDNRRERGKQTLHNLFRPGGRGRPQHRGPSGRDGWPRRGQSLPGQSLQCGSSRRH